VGRKHLLISENGTVGNVPYPTAQTTTYEIGTDEKRALLHCPNDTYEIGTVGNVPYPTSRTTTYEFGTDEKRALLHCPNDNI
jgi:hypothetical protein